MIYIENETQLNEVVNEGVTIVDFYANWCGPCRMLGPVLEDFSDTNTNIKIAKVDVDENRELAMKYHISAIPALLFFKDGKLVKNEIGFKTFDDLEEILKEINA